MVSKQTRGERALLDRIKHLAGLTTLDEAAVALTATLSALGDRLPDEERNQVATAVPTHVGAVLKARKYRGDFDATELYERVCKYERVQLGFAREHAQVVCRALGELLPEKVTRALDETLPTQVAELFHRVEEPRLHGDRKPSTVQDHASR